MTSDADINRLCQLLFEIGLGNFNFQTGNIQSVEVLNVMQRLKEITNEIQKLINQQEYYIPHFRYQTLSQATILIDDKLKILNCNDYVLEMTDYTAEEIVNMHLVKIIDSTDRAFFKNTILAILNKNSYHVMTFPILWKTKKGKLISIFCTVTKLIHSQQIIINSITTTLQQLADDTRYYATSTNYESALIKKLILFISDNLHQKLPTTKDLATRFGTNEYTLKALFRKYMSTSIYQFYSQERLKEAHDLITNTTMPLQDIAVLSGYNKYRSFYKAFKKHYKYGPGQLKRLR